MESWIVTKIELDVDKNEIGRFVFKEFTADSAGNVIDETEYNPDSTVANKRIYRYFDTGEVKDFVEYDPMDQLLERHTYVANDSGDVDKIIYEYGDGRKIIKEFNYTDLGFADKATLKNENNSITGYETHILNEAGQLVEYIETDSNNSETARCVKSYHENGLPAHDEQFTDGVLTETITYFYCEKGNMIRKIIRNKIDNYEVIEEYTYDDHGNMLHNINIQNGVVVFENKCSYDAENNLIAEEYFEINFWEKRISRHEKLIHERKQ